MIPEQAELQHAAAAEIQQRVDAWLAGRTAWIEATPRRMTLAVQWRHVSRVLGADSDAARGVLLGLVREGHGDWWIHTEPVDFDDPDQNFWLAAGLGRVVSDNDESVALLRALELAPT